MDPYACYYINVKALEIIRKKVLHQIGEGLLKKVVFPVNFLPIR
jgi:hypothetical protein